MLILLLLLALSGSAAGYLYGCAVGRNFVLHRMRDTLHRSYLKGREDAIRYVTMS